MIAETFEQIETVEWTRRRFTVDEFLRMAEARVLGAGGGLELIWGQIVEKGTDKRHTFTVGDYLCLTEKGILQEDERLELIQGEIVELSPADVAHISTLNRLTWLLTNALGKRVILSIQNPVQLSGQSLPQPDLVVLPFQADFYSERHIGPDDITLIIEVADTSLRYDKRIKSKLYGAAGIADYWIVNLSERRIEVYREPRPEGYRTMTYYAPGETLSPLVFPDIVLLVDEVLGAKSE